MRVVLTMPRELVDRIDDYRFAHRFKSRAEAVRALVEASLRRQPRPRDEPK